MKDILKKVRRGQGKVEGFPEIRGLNAQKVQIKVWDERFCSIHLE